MNGLGPQNFQGIYMVIVSQSPRSNGRLLNVPCNPFCCTSKQSACKATNCKSSKSLGVHSNLLLDLLLLLCRGLLFPFYHVASKEPKEILFLRAIAACDQQISNPQHMRTFFTYLPNTWSGPILTSYLSNFPFSICIMNHTFGCIWCLHGNTSEFVFFARPCEHSVL